MHLAVSQSGTVKPCCIAQDNLEIQPDQPFDVTNHDLNHIWNSPTLNNLRKQLIDGKKPDTCTRCWDEERLGIHSKRLRENEAWHAYVQLEAQPSPAFIDLKLGNLCNLKCRICSRYASSKFAAEEHEMFGNFNLESLQEKTKWSQETDNLFWTRLDEWLPRIDHLDVYGGEPFLSKPHFALLERTVQQGHSKKQSLHYNTNGTIFPKKAVEDIWPHFKSVEIMFSIDGVGERFTYQRHPAQWETVEENIDKFMKYAYLKLKVCYTVNAMNIWYLPEFCQWCTKKGLAFWVNYLHDPIYFKAQIFSDAAKKKIESRLRSIAVKANDPSNQIAPLVNFMWDKQHSSSDRQKFLRHIEIYDHHRKESFKDLFPEAYSLMQMN